MAETPECSDKTNVAVWKVALLSHIATSFFPHRYRTCERYVSTAELLDHRKLNLKVMVFRDVAEEVA